MTDTRGQLDEALAKLELAMQPPPGGSTDPERRRAAAKLAELVRAEDADLAGYAKRHLPGRAVDVESLRAARELLLGVARLFDLQGKAPGATAAVADLGSSADEWIEKLGREIEQAAARTSDDAPPAEPFAAPAKRAPSPLASTTPSFQAVVPGRIAPPVAVAVVAPPLASVAASPPSLGAPPIAPLAAAPPPISPPRAAPMPFASPAAGRSPVVAAVSPSLAPSFVPSLAPATADMRDEPPPSRVLPFSPAPSSSQREPASMRAPTLAEGTSPPARPRAEHHPLSMTMSGEPANHAEAAPLPFVSGGAGAQARAPQRSDGALPFAAPRRADEPLPPHLAAIDLAKHASLTAALAVLPQHHAGLFAQYGLRGSGDREILDRHWLAKLAADPALAAQWIQLRDRAAQYYRERA